MNIDIRIRGQLPADILRREIQAATESALGRFGADITSVHVRVVDINGPRRGVDMHVVVSATGPRFGVVTVEDLHEAPTLAVAAALERVERAIQRDLDRLRHRPSLRRHLGGGGASAGR